MEEHQRQTPQMRPSRPLVAVLTSSGRLKVAREPEAPLEFRELAELAELVELELPVATVSLVSGVELRLGPPLVEPSRTQVGSVAIQVVAAELV